MSPYLEHMRSKSPHERRSHSMKVAGVLTALVFLGWVTSLGFGGGSSPAATVASDNNQTQTAAVAQVLPQTGNQLIVATSTQ